MYEFQFAKQTNRSNWLFTGQLLDADDQPMDLSGSSMVLGVYDKDGAEVLVGSTDNGLITLNGEGMFTWDFPATSMRGLCKGTYSIGLTLTDGDGRVTQIGVGALPIVDGYVP